MFARSPKAPRNRNREREKEERDNLATKGFTARNHHSVWKFEFYLVVGVRYRPGRRPLMKLQPPLQRENFFFFISKNTSRRVASARSRRVASTPASTTTLISFRLEGTRDSIVAESGRVGGLYLSTNRRTPGADGYDWLNWP